MIKLDFFRSLTNVVVNSLIRLLVTTVVVLIFFNLSWLLMIVIISSRTIIIKDIDTTISNLELLLVFGNSVIITALTYLIKQNLKLEKS